MILRFRTPGCLECPSQWGHRDFSLTREDCHNDTPEVRHDGLLSPPSHDSTLSQRLSRTHLLEMARRRGAHRLRPGACPVAAGTGRPAVDQHSAGRPANPALSIDQRPRTDLVTIADQTDHNRGKGHGQIAMPLIRQVYPVTPHTHHLVGIEESASGLAADRFIVASQLG